MAELVFPFGGMNRRMSYQHQEPYTTPTCWNVMPRDCGQGRIRGGSRPGFVLDNDLSKDQVTVTPIDLLTTASLPPATWMKDMGCIEENFVIGQWRRQWNTSFAAVQPFRLADDIAMADPGTIAGAGYVLSDYNTDAGWKYLVSVRLALPRSFGDVRYILYAMMDDAQPNVLDSMVATLRLRDDGDSFRYWLRGGRYVNGVWFVGTEDYGTVNGPMALLHFVMMASQGGGNIICGASWGNRSATAALIQGTAPKGGIGVAVDATQTTASGCGISDITVWYQKPTQTPNISADMVITRIRMPGLETLHASPPVYGTIASFKTVSEHITPIVTQQFDDALYFAHATSKRAISGYDGQIGNGSGGGYLDRFSAPSVNDWIAKGVTTIHALLLRYGTASGLYTINSVYQSHLRLSTPITPGGAGDLGSFSGISYEIVPLPLMVVSSRGFGNPLQLKSWTYNADGSRWRESTVGITPTNCPIVSRHMGRIVLAGNPPNVWYMSRVGDPMDWDFGADPFDTARAIASTSSNDLGVIGETITAVIPWQDDRSLFCSASGCHMMVGDPADGGVLLDYSNTVGCLGQFAWTLDSSGALYMVSSDGVYRCASPNSAPENISEAVRRDLSCWLDGTGNYITLVWDFDRNGMWLFISPRVPPGSAPRRGWHVFWSADTGGWFPISFEDYASQPSCAIYVHSGIVTHRGLLVGTCGGHVARVLTNVSADSTRFKCWSVRSGVEIGPIKLGDSDASTGSIEELHLVMDESSSGEVTLGAKMGRDAHHAHTSPSVTLGSFDLKRHPGRQYPLRPRIDGGAAFITLGSYDKLPWALEMIELVRGRPAEMRLP